MNSLDSYNRFVQLEPMNVQMEETIAILAMEYFSPSEILKRRNPNDNGPITPPSGGDFLKHLDKVGVTQNSQKIIYQIRDLLQHMERANLLVSFPSNNNFIPLPFCYYNISEFSILRTQGTFWLSKALGGRFLYEKISPLIVHIIGCKDGVENEGSGIIFDSNHILTCKHVTSGMKVAKRQNFQGKAVTIEKIYEHEKIDVSVIKTKETLTPEKGLGYLRPQITQKVYRFGCSRIPCSLPNETGKSSIESGEVTLTSVKIFNSNEFFLYSAISRPGDSGGAIVSEDGYIVGMTTQMSDMRNSENIFSPHYAGVPSQVIATAVEELNLDVRIPYENFD